MINTSLTINRLSQASYWLGRMAETFNSEDFEGYNTSRGFFKNNLNYLLRFKDQNPESDFTESIDSIYSEYMDLEQEYEQLDKGELV
jgi:hypothetical protein